MAPELKPVYLLTGSDRPKVARALERLRGHFEAEAVELLSANDTGGEDTVAACNAGSLFGGGRRLVVVGDVDGHRDAYGRRRGGWKAADIAAVAAYLKGPAPDTVLALVAEEVRKESPLGKACAAAGDILLYEAAKKELPKWVGERFRAHGVHADRSACELLVDLVGEDTIALATEVDKLAVWSGGERVDEHAVVELCVPGETPLWDLTDAWGRRDVSAALSACEALLERGPAARRSEVIRLSAVLAAHVELVRSCQRLAAQGVRPAEAARQLGRRQEYPVRKAYEHAERVREDELRDAVVRLARLDLALKGGSRAPGELELERALVEVTRRPEPAGRQEPPSKTSST